MLKDGSIVNEVKVWRREDWDDCVGKREVG